MSGKTGRISSNHIIRELWTAPCSNTEQATFVYRQRGAIVMIIGKVVGSLFSTRKSEKLVGNKFMIVEPVANYSGAGTRLVAIDIIGAGIGEYVLVAKGSAARIGCDMADAPVDAAIVGIIDEGQDWSK